MMKNAGALAAWIEELTGGVCLALDMPWKPTRQLRGSIVYRQERVDELERTLRAAKYVSTTKYPPVAVKRSLTAEPLALFGLKQTWASLETDDYALVALSNDDVTLGASQYWRSTPNAVVVTSAIGAAAAQSGVKTLAFFQSIKNATSAAKGMSDHLGPADIKLEQDELAWAETAILEFGGSTHLYLQLRDGRLVDQATVHHGLLLPEERRLCESLYRRKGGLRALSATSTLAQGMNLPCELVIIGEDSRFDQAKDRKEILEAQELLNAAGRAGRAGQGAAGVVLVVPGKVVGIDLAGASIGDHWGTLRDIFGQSDQCLDIDDPLTAILDRVHVSVDTTGEIERYAIARLVASGNGSTSEERLESSIGATFAAYKARQRGEDSWVHERKVSAAQYFHLESSEAEESPIEGQIAASLGLPVDLVERLSDALATSQPGAGANISHWRRWFFDWLADNVDLLEKAFRPRNLAELFGQKIYHACATDQDRANLVLPTLRKLTRLWMKGRPLKVLEVAAGTDPGKVKTCDKARRFAVRIVPDLGYLFGLPGLLHARAQADEEAPIAAPPPMAQLGRCARLGLNSYEKVAVSQILRAGRLSRRQVHQRYSQIERYIEAGSFGENWDDVVARVRRAMKSELF